MNKGRPRPVRHHRRKPVALKEQANDQPDSIWTKTSVDEPDNTAAVSSKSKTPEPANKSKTPEPAKSKTPEPFIKPKTPEAVKTDDSKYTHCYYITLVTISMYFFSEVPWKQSQLLLMQKAFLKES